MDNLGKIILLLVGVGFVSFALFGIILPKLVGEKTPESLCRSTVSLRAATTTEFLGSDIKLSPIACETMEREIEGDREEIKAQLAQLMSKCWWMFNEGRQDSLLKDNWKDFFGWSDNENGCFVCYDAFVDSSKVEGGPIGAEEMFDYMINSDHYNIKGLKNIDYIQSYGGSGKIAILSPIFDRREKERYGIAYMSKTSDDAEFSGTDWVVTLASVGVLACIVAEPCGAIVGTVAGTVATVTAGVTAGAVLTYEGAHAKNVIEAKTKFYDAKRKVSMIALDDYNALQEAKCKVVKVED